MMLTDQRTTASTFVRRLRRTYVRHFRSHKAAMSAVLDLIVRPRVRFLSCRLLARLRHAADTENVCLLRKAGSDWRTVKATRMTRL